MTAAQANLVKEVFLERCKRHHFGLFVFSFWFIIFFNLQSFGEGLDFCFDGSKEGKVWINGFSYKSELAAHGWHIIETVAAIIKLFC